MKQLGDCVEMASEVALGPLRYTLTALSRIRRLIATNASLTYPCNQGRLWKATVWVFDLAESELYPPF